MRRWLLKLALFLILGAIVNVAVAWGCVLMLPPLHVHGGFADNERMLDGEESAAILRQSFPDAPITPSETYGVTQNRGGWTTFHVSWSATDNVSVFLDRVVTKAGWPTPSVCGHWQWDGRNPSGEEDRFVGALAVPEWAKPNEGARRLIDFVPYGPLWPGFAINTVFYGVIVWLLFAGPFVVRRWRRIRRGLCPKCAYDLRGRPPKDAEKCPECGSIVAS